MSVNEERKIAKQEERDAAENEAPAPLIRKGRKQER